MNYKAVLETQYCALTDQSALGALYLSTSAAHHMINTEHQMHLLHTEHDLITLFV